MELVETVIVFANQLAMVIRTGSRGFPATLLACALWITSAHGTLLAQPQEPLACLPYAQFKIPFSVDSAGAEPAQVQLWVSTDDGQSWQMHGTVPSNSKQFDFRAAAEGMYLFKVHTIDASGAPFPSPNPPLRVLVDTTKPQTAVRADINSQGQLVVEARVLESNLEPNSAQLRVRSNQDSRWREVAVDLQAADDEIYHAQAIVDLTACREIAVAFTVKDQAGNQGEATCTFSMPRTAAGDREMTLASTTQKDGGSASVIPSPQWHSLPGASVVA